VVVNVQHKKHTLHRIPCMLQQAASSLMKKAATLDARKKENARLESPAQHKYASVLV
jgi:hypothetical protein